MQHALIRSCIPQVLLSTEAVIVLLLSDILTMSRVDLKTNETELLKARDAILNDETTRKYVIFGGLGLRLYIESEIFCAGYGDSGQSNSLIVEEEGEDEACSGLESLVTEFNSGRWETGDKYSQIAIIIEIFEGISTGWLE